MPKPNDCQARQHSDQMICARCGIVWDVNDPDPPTCLDEVPKPKTNTKRKVARNEQRSV